MKENLIVTAILIILGVAFVFIGISSRRLRAKLIESGKRATATVTDVTTRMVKRNNNRRVTQYVCKLEYPADNKTQTAKYSTETATVAGEKIEIAYLPDNPGKFMPADQLTDSAMNKILPLIFIVIGVILLIVGAIVAIVAFA